MTGSLAVIIPNSSFNSVPVEGTPHWRKKKQKIVQEHIDESENINLPQVLSVADYAQWHIVSIAL